MNASFPSTRELIKESLGYLKQRSDLVLLVALPLVVIAIFEFVNLNFASVQNLEFIIFSGVVVILAAIFNFVAVGAALYAVVKSPAEVVGIKAALAWSRSNILKIGWVYILSSLAVLGGTVLFLIPGLIISLYVYFANFIYINEGVKGMEALLRSHALVKGSWWSLFKAMFKVVVFIFVVLITFAVLTELLQRVSGHYQSTVNLFSSLLLQVFSGAVTIFGFSIGNALYRNLLKQEVERGEPLAVVAKWKYQALITLGVLVIVGMVFALVLVIKNGWLMTPNNDLRIESGLEAKDRMMELRQREQGMDFKVNS